MKFIALMFFTANAAALMAGQIQEAPSDAAVAIIRDALKTAETEGIEAALARLSAESGDTERMLVRAFQQVAGQTLPARGELMFQLQVRTRLEGFEDLQWVLTHDAKKYSITALTSYLSPVAGSIVAKVKLANSAVIHLSLSGDRKSIYAQTMDGTLHILDAKTLAVVGTSQPKGWIVGTLAGPDGDLIFRIGEPGMVFIDSLATNEKVSRYPGNGGEDTSTAQSLKYDHIRISEDIPVAISPDRRDFVTPRDRMLHVTDSQGKDKERWDLGIRVYPRISIDEDPATKKGLSGARALGIEFINESDLQIASADGSIVRISYRNKKCNRSRFQNDLCCYGGDLLAFGHGRTRQDH